THIVDAKTGEEPQRGRIAGMLTADTDLEARIGRPAALDGNGDHFAHPLLIDGDERVSLVDALALIGREECGRVVARYAESGLRQVVGAKGNKVHHLGYFARPQAG